MILYCFKLHRSYSISFNLSKVGEIIRGWILKDRMYVWNKKRMLYLTYSIKWAREIRKFHIAVVQLWLRNVQKSVMPVQSCCFARINLLLFCRSRCRRCRRCFSSILLWSTYFATMVTWCHSTSLYWRFVFFWLTATNSPEPMMDSDDDYNFDSDFSWWEPLLTWRATWCWICSRLDFKMITWLSGSIIACVAGAWK